ncbi:MAG: hypothetical protein ACOY5Y_07035 [Pseudomonadota bacterium]
MTLKRVNLLADFTFRTEGGERTFTAGNRNLPADAAAEAARLGLLGKSPARKPAAKAGSAKKAPAKAKA